MANLNSVQTSQPNPLLSVVSAGASDAQENHIDQSVSTFPDELKAAKGKAVASKSDQDQTDAQNPSPADPSVQNLPIAAVANPNVPANNAAPAPAAAVTTAVVEDVVLAAGAKKLDVTLAGADVSTAALNTAAVNPNSIASQAAFQANLAADIAAGAAQTATTQVANVTAKVDAAASSPVQQLVEQLAPQVQVAQNTALDAAVQSTTIQTVQVAKQDLASAQNLVQVAPVTTAPIQVIANTDANVVSAAATEQINAPVVDTQNTQTVAANVSAVTQQVVVKAIESSPTQEVVLPTAVSQAITPNQTANSVTTVTPDQMVAVTAQASVAVASNTPQATQAQTNSDTQQAMLDASQPAQAATTLAGAASAVTQTANTPSDSQSTQDNTTIDPAAVVAKPVTQAPVATAVSNANMIGDAKSNQLDKSASIQAVRSDTSKTIKELNFAAAEKVASVEKKDQAKVDSSNVGMIKTDAGQTSFAANLNQEIKLSQGTTIKLEPHEASLSAGPLNAGVMQALKEGGGRVVMELSHPDQGTIQLDLRLDNQGKAYLTVEGASDSTRARLEQGSSQLKDQLASMGLSLTLDMRQQSENPGHFAMLKDAATNSNAKTGSAEEAAAVNPLLTRKTTVEGRINLYA